MGEAAKRQVSDSSRHAGSRIILFAIRTKQELNRQVAKNTKERHSIGRFLGVFCALAVKSLYKHWSLQAMEKEYIDRAKAIREGILQLRDSL